MAESETWQCGALESTGNCIKWREFCIRMRQNRSGALRRYGAAPIISWRDENTATAFNFMPSYRPRNDILRLCPAFRRHNRVENHNLLCRGVAAPHSGMVSVCELKQVMKLSSGDSRWRLNRHKPEGWPGSGQNFGQGMA
jgi:hypothetical protein